MGYYELLNHNTTRNSGHELYHHGVKGQKWGVIRERKRAANRKVRSQKAKEAIERSNGSKSVASLKRIGVGTLRWVGQNWLASSAATATLTIGMNAVAPPVAAAAFVATTGIALTNAGFNVQNIYKTGRDVHDIVKHEDGSSYLVHHGVLGQRWGIRRFQEESGALTGLGKQRANLDADWHSP